MKTIQKWFLPLFLLTAVTFLFPACDGNTADDNLTGVITVKMRNADHGNTHIPFASGPNQNNETSSAILLIENDNNFKFWTDVPASICDVGKKKLSAIKSIPESGWAEKISVQPQHAYVIRVGGKVNYYGNYSVYEYAYYKLRVIDYIESTSGGIIGAEVKYCEWNPK